VPFKRNLQRYTGEEEEGTAGIETETEIGGTEIGTETEIGIEIGNIRARRRRGNAGRILRGEGPCER
jgi:hypothetical protein